VAGKFRVGGGGDRAVSRAKGQGEKPKIQQETRKRKGDRRSKLGDWQKKPEIVGTHAGEPGGGL